MKFILLVEGYTEKNVVAEFLKRWLDAQLTIPVGIKCVRRDGWGDLFDFIRDNPTVRLNDLKNGGDIIAMIGLIDLYGPTFYPKNLTSTKERYEYAVDLMEKKANHPRFRQFLAVHETEAWLLSDHAIFPPEIRKALKRLPEPERVNSHEPPAKMLDRLYQQHLSRAYRKVTDGTNLFKKLDPQKAYDACPYLREMLDTMLELAQAAQKKR